jgi:Ca-activated chloride channel homolog
LRVDWVPLNKGMPRLVLALTIAGIVVPRVSSDTTGIRLQQPAFRAGVRTVAIYATVQERNGRLVPDLTRADFEVRDNGQPVELTVFSNEALPITVALMLDMSNSMVEEFEQVREAALHFVKLLGPDDRVRIGSFGTEVALSPHLTADKQLLARVLDEELWPGGPTPLWSALHAAMGSLVSEPGRRVVLALSDGDDACGMRIIPMPRAISGAPRPFESQNYCSTFTRVSGRAVREDFMVYAIGMPDLSGDMRGLSVETGGGFFTLGGDANLSQAFARVVEELRHQYLLGFSPATLDRRTHTLEVRVRRPGLTARARKSYIATDER